MILIVPSADVQAASGSVKTFVHLTFPFGVAALGAILERDGVRVKIVNDAITPVDAEKIRSLAALENGRPVFGLTSLTLQAHRAKQLLSLIRQTIPSARVIVGGVHATNMAEEFLSAGFDYAVIGEAELTITEIATNLSQDRDVSHIPGLVWKTPDGRIRRNSPNRELVDLAKIPMFPFHLFEEDIPYYDMGVVMATRGCPYKCIFCSQRSMTGISFRTKPVEMVLSEVETVVNKYGAKYVYFIDDNMVVNRKWTLALCDGLVSKGLNKKMSFFCQTRGDAVVPEIVSKLKEAGCDTLSFGIETGSERIANIIQKGETVEANKQAVFTAKKYGLRVAATFIIGFPTETKADREQTIKLAMELPLDVMRINIAIPYPGTPLYEMTKDKLCIYDGWKNFNVVSPMVTGPFRALPLPYVPEGATESELRFLMMWTNLWFWLRPSGIKRFFSGASTGVTRMPSEWFLKPDVLWSIVKLGWTVVLLIGWVAVLGIKTYLRRLWLVKPGTQHC